MTRATAKLADGIAADLLRFGKIDDFRTGEASFRDYCDISTGSDLSAGELDKLALMVQSRVIKATVVA